MSEKSLSHRTCDFAAVLFMRKQEVRNWKMNVGWEESHTFERYTRLMAHLVRRISIGPLLRIITIALRVPPFPAVQTSGADHGWASFTLRRQRAYLIELLAKVDGVDIVALQVGKHDYLKTNK